MKPLEEIQAAANKAWMAYENDMGDDFLAFTDAFVAVFEPLLEAERAKNAALVEVLGEVKRYCESGNRGGATRLPASDKFRAEGMYQEVIEALAANEKGGVQG